MTEEETDCTDNNLTVSRLEDSGRMYDARASQCKSGSSKPSKPPVNLKCSALFPTHEEPECEKQKEVWKTLHAVTQTVCRCGRCLFRITIVAEKETDCTHKEETVQSKRKQTVQTKRKQTVHRNRKQTAQANRKQTAQTKRKQAAQRGNRLHRQQLDSFMFGGQ